MKLSSHRPLGVALPHGFGKAVAGLLAAGVLLLARPASAEEAAALDATDLPTLHTHVGQAVDVQGTPTGIGHSKDSSVVYLNFGRAHQAVALVFFLKGRGGAAIQSEDELKPFMGKKITAHGQLTDFKGDLQIVVSSLDQIKAAP